ncbi:MAG TPA: putative metal-binding motif-containing protein, partial [Candidatus Nanoarchaeia archaeon]|nr:putative metal-binding motif-containing protein [Candidatus Nanoarchaeia archaeon]
MLKKRNIQLNLLYVAFAALIIALVVSVYIKSYKPLAAVVPLEEDVVGKAAAPVPVAPAALVLSYADIIAGQAGDNSNSQVRVFLSSNGAFSSTSSHQFGAYGSANTEGKVVLAACDTDGDNVDEIIVGQGPNAGNYIRVFEYGSTTPSQQIGAYGAATKGISIACGKIDAVVCIDNDSDGFTNCEGDCDDSNVNVNPGASEVCNNIDDNCNGVIEDNEDYDNDGKTLCAGDCNDYDNEISPDAPESCGDGVDNDCDLTIDDGCGVCLETYVKCENNQPMKCAVNQDGSIAWVNEGDSCNSQAKSCYEVNIEPQPNYPFGLGKTGCVGSTAFNLNRASNEYGYIEFPSGMDIGNVNPNCISITYGHVKIDDALCPNLVLPVYVRQDVKKGAVYTVSWDGNNDGVFERPIENVDITDIDANTVSVGYNVEHLGQGNTVSAPDKYCTVFGTQAACNSNNCPFLMEKCLGTDGVKYAFKEFKQGASFASCIFSVSVTTCGTAKPCNPDTGKCECSVDCDTSACSPNKCIDTPPEGDGCSECKPCKSCTPPDCTKPICTLDNYGCQISCECPPSPCANGCGSGRQCATPPGGCPTCVDIVCDPPGCTGCNTICYAGGSDGCV